MQQAQASVQSIDAQIERPAGADRRQPGAARSGAGGARVRAAAGGTLPGRWRKQGWGTVQNAQQFTSQLHQQEAAVQTAQENLNLAQRQLAALTAQRLSAEASLAQAKAQLDQAQVNLERTRIRLSGRRLRDEPVGAARRLRQRRREHHRRSSTPIHSGSTGISRKRTLLPSASAIRPKSS